jgi:hypothetical protein
MMHMKNDKGCLFDYELVTDLRSWLGFYPKKLLSLNAFCQLLSSPYVICASDMLYPSDLVKSKTRFMRAAGAVAGVVLEKHLHEVCAAHGVKIGKKNPCIADLNEALKNSGVIGTTEWRFNQHLADIRNLCDHNKDKEPTSDQVNDLIAGVTKVTKTVF